MLSWPLLLACGRHTWTGTGPSTAAGGGGYGRLTAEELDERLEAALTARTYGELAALTTDLPAVPDFAPGPPAPEPKDLARIDCRGSSVKRDGRWLVPQRMDVRVTGGSVTLDFTDAVIVRPSLLLDADVNAGRLTLVTKPGVVVDTDDVAAEGSYLKVRAHPGPEVPAILRIQVSGKVSGGHITARPPRRASGRGCGAIPSPAGLPHPDLTAMTDPGPLSGQRALSLKAANSGRSPPVTERRRAAVPTGANSRRSVRVSSCRGTSQSCPIVRLRSCHAIR